MRGGGGGTCRGGVLIGGVVVEASAASAASAVAVVGEEEACVPLTHEVLGMDRGGFDLVLARRPKSKVSFGRSSSPSSACSAWWRSSLTYARDGGRSPRSAAVEGRPCVARPVCAWPRPRVASGALAAAVAVAVDGRGA